MEVIAAPAGDAAQRLVGGHRLRVGARLGERGEAVADAGHAAEDADLLALEGARVAAAVHALVVLRDALEHLHRPVGRRREDLQPEGHVALHGLELLRREAALLLEERARKLDLADVEQQPDRAQLRQLGPGKAQVAAEGHEVDGHLQAVPVGGDVLLAQPRHPHEGVRVAHHALDHLVDDLLDAGDLHGMPGPDVGGELPEHLGGALVGGRARGRSPPRRCGCPGRSVTGIDGGRSEARGGSGASSAGSAGMPFSGRRSRPRSESMSPPSPCLDGGGCAPGFGGASPCAGPPWPSAPPRARR